MNSLLKYSLPSLFIECQKNRHLIHAYLNNKSIEGYDKDSNKIIGLSIGIFLIILLINLALFIWSLILLIKNWHVLPSWAKVIGLLMLFIPPGPLVTIIVCLVAKE